MLSEERADLTLTRGHWKQAQGQKRVGSGVGSKRMKRGIVNGVEQREVTEIGGEGKEPRRLATDATAGRRLNLMDQPEARTDGL